MYFLNLSCGSKIDFVYKYNWRNLKYLRKKYLRNCTQTNFSARYWKVLSTLIIHFTLHKPYLSCLCFLYAFGIGIGRQKSFLFFYYIFCWSDVCSLCVWTGTLFSFNLILEILFCLNPSLFPISEAYRTDHYQISFILKSLCPLVQVNSSTSYQMSREY